MKAYESVEAQRRVDAQLPIMVRLDGRAFHSFTRGLQRPFDARLTDCMVEAARAAMLECGAAVAYTQSDEITLVVLPAANLAASTPYNARVSKLCSLLAAVASVSFNAALGERIPSHAHKARQPLRPTRPAHTHTHPASLIGT